MPDNSEQSNVEAEGDLLRGAPAIAAYLRSLGLTDVTEGEVYYLDRSGKLSLGRFGKELIASRNRLRRDLQKAAKAPASADAKSPNQA